MRMSSSQTRPAQRAAPIQRNVKNVKRQCLFACLFICRHRAKSAFAKAKCSSHKAYKASPPFAAMSTPCREVPARCHVQRHVRVKVAKMVEGDRMTERCGTGVGGWGHGDMHQARGKCRCYGRVGEESLLCSFCCLYMACQTLVCPCLPIHFPLPSSPSSPPSFLPPSWSILPRHLLATLPAMESIFTTTLAMPLPLYFLSLFFILQV